MGGVVDGLVSGRELGDDAFEGGPGADDEAEDAEDNYNGVLDDHAVAFGVGHVVPVGAALDKGGEGQAEGGEAERSEQRDEQVQFRHGRGDSDCNDTDIRLSKQPVQY